jgi:hypothetical protein
MQIHLVEAHAMTGACQWLQIASFSDPEKELDRAHGGILALQEGIVSVPSAYFRIRRCQYSMKVITWFTNPY